MKTLRLPLIANPIVHADQEKQCDMDVIEVKGSYLKGYNAHDVSEVSRLKLELDITNFQVDGVGNPSATVSFIRERPALHNELTLTMRTTCLMKNS